MSPPRVLHVVDTLSPGGTERMAVELANLTDPVRYESGVCATRAGGALAASLDPRVGLAELKRLGRWDWGGLERFGRLVRERSIAVVHSHGRGSMKFVATARMAFMLRYAHVFHDHYGHVEGVPPPGIGDRICASVGFDAYVGVHRGLCEWAVRRLRMRPDRVHLVRNGVDVSRFVGGRQSPLCRELGWGDDVVVLVMTANFRPQKDHLLALAALARCPERDRLRLLLLGQRSPAHEPYERACDEYIRDAGLAGNVVTAGVRSDVPEILVACDAGVLSSRSESGPLALLEYLAAGLPYVVTDTGEITRAVRGTDTGFIVSVGDIDGMAAAMAALARMSPEDRRAMGERGRQLATREFDQRATVGKVMDIYDAVLGKADSPRRGSDSP